ncbi:MAG: 30S ribosomal protein S7 [Candidatus Pacebacteria bacterium]|nr:30S ribosomal protein S7 [Candidatus Paceibacterota bacterium]MDD5721606.1 30S ribosomal protein S7 [Candidatus Paceibacterota bacterium]
MRGEHQKEKQYEPDLKYKSALVTRFINYLMKDGKKSTAQRVFYNTMDIIEKTAKQEPIAVFNLAVKNVSPELEVKTRRIGGANYQVPQVVPEYRKTTLASRWLINASRAKKGKSMAERLAEELILASKNEGAAMKKKLDTHRIAEANRAFAHFSF